MRRSDPSGTLGGSRTSRDGAGRAEPVRPRAQRLGSLLGSGLFAVGAVVLTAASIGALLVPASMAVAARSLYRAARTATGRVTPLQRGL